MRFPSSYFDHVRIPTPAAGQPVIYRISGETWASIGFLRFTLTTSAAVANRFAAIDILDGDGVINFRSVSGAALVAATPRNYTAFPEAGSNVTGAGTDESLPMTGVILPPGFSVRITAAALDVADQFSSIFAYLCRYPSGAWAPSPGATPYEP